MYELLQVIRFAGKINNGNFLSLQDNIYTPEQGAVTLVITSDLYRYRDVGSGGALPG